MLATTNIKLRDMGMGLNVFILLILFNIILIVVISKFYELDGKSVFNDTYWCYFWNIWHLFVTVWNLDGVNHMNNANGMTVKLINKNDKMKMR